MQKISLALFWVFFASNILIAQDTVYFFTGERVVGELKSLEQGNLKFDTEEMDIVIIDWDDVASLKTFGLFELTLRNRSNHFGNFAYGDTVGQIVFVEESGKKMILDPDLIVSVSSLEQGFWNKIDARIDLGLSYTKASNVLQYNMGGKISYTDKKIYTQIKGSIVVTEQDIKPTSQKADLSYGFQYSYIKRWYVGLGVGTERNTELQLDARYFGGLSLGNDFVYTNIHKLYGQIGSIMNVERALDSTGFSQSAEGLISAGYLLYNSGVRDLHIDINVVTYPSFTVAGRWRGELNVNPKIEIINDLDFGLNYYYIFDTKPLTESASTEDWGIITSLSYTF